MYIYLHGLPWWLSGKEAACNAGDMHSIPGLGRFPGEGCGNPLGYSCLENPVDRGAWSQSSWWRLMKTEQKNPGELLTPADEAADHLTCKLVAASLPPSKTYMPWSMWVSVLSLDTMNNAGISFKVITLSISETLFISFRSQGWKGQSWDSEQTRLACVSSVRHCKVTASQEGREGRCACSIEHVVSGFRPPWTQSSQVYNLACPLTDGETWGELPNLSLLQFPPPQMGLIIILKSKTVCRVRALTQLHSLQQCPGL